MNKVLLSHRFRMEKKELPNHNLAFIIVEFLGEKYFLHSWGY